MAEYTPLLNGIRPPGNSFVLPEHKMVYISVTKVACTSLRWMIADLAGEDFETFYRSGAYNQSRLMTIHGGRNRWRHTPQLAELDPAVAAEISRDNGWFIFAVVRDPWSRIWSAWQSKFLVRHGAYQENYGAEPWFPRVPRKSGDVLEDWAAFIDAKPWLSNPLLVRDWHFRPQVESVRPRRINYTRVYDLKDMDQLFADVRAHLESVGRPHELYVPRANETPLRMTAEVLDNGVEEAIREAYRSDFRAFGDRWRVEDLRLPRGEWSADAISHAAYHTVANERISDLSRELRAAQHHIRNVARSSVLAPAVGLAALTRRVRRTVVARGRRPG